jgi:tRNA-2-methylthio-N6-dimethylallyladenosine synthase
MLLAAGYQQALEGSQPDLVVFNTCAVRENADNKLYGRLSFLAPLKKQRPDFQIAIGGCMAQKDKEQILKRAPYVDVVFGTHNLGSLPILLERARIEEAAQVEIKESLEHFPSTLPTKRHSPFSAWVSISVGCDNTCTFCIVPSLRGKEEDREESDILAEVSELVAQGVVEVTLLGQNVNAYKHGGFAALLNQVAQIPGLLRLRFMSPHPRDFTEDVIEVMAAHPNIMPHLHMPLQSGSDSVLARMRRSYRVERYRQIIAGVRELLPNAAITTDIIVGFPGESEAEFAATVDLVKEIGFTAAYTFEYSARPGTPAATMADQVPPDITNQRYQRLHQIQQSISLQLNEELVGKAMELLIFEPGKARTPDFRLVHLLNSAGDLRPGDLVTAVIERATPNYLLASEILSQVKTAGGDSYEKEQALMKERGGAAIMLGMPSLKVLKDITGV